MHFTIGSSRSRWLVLVFVLLGMINGGVQDALADSWDTELGTGQQISIDPTTNRAEIQSGVGRGRPLWDGVHRLSDGSTITIRSGVVVPNEALQTYQPSPVAPTQQTAEEGAITPQWPERSRGSCDELLLKCCGLYQRCAGRESCALARQLRTLQHQSEGAARDDADWAEQRCREALKDENTFTACDREPPLETVACRELLDRVCSGRPRCDNSPSCQTAQELFDLEQAALEKGAKAELELIQPRCVEVLADHAFFPPCR